MTGITDNAELETNPRKTETTNNKINVYDFFHHVRPIIEEYKFSFATDPQKVISDLEKKAECSIGTDKKWHLLVYSHYNKLLAIK